MPQELGLKLSYRAAAPFAGYYRIRAGTSTDTKEFDPGMLIADYDDNGQLLGIEILGPINVDLLAAICENQRAELFQEVIASAGSVFGTIGGNSDFEPPKPSMPVRAVSIQRNN